MSPFKMKSVEDYVPLDAPGKFVLDKEGVAAVGVGLIVGVVTYIAGAAQDVSALYAIGSMWAAAIGMPYSRK